MTESKYLTDNIITQETWQDYIDIEGSSITGFCGYVAATEEITECLEELSNKCNSFTELKDELLQFIKNRKEFTEYAGLHYP